MSCMSCTSSNQTEFPAEVNILFPASAMQANPASLCFRNFWSALIAAIPRS